MSEFFGSSHYESERHPELNRSAILESLIMFCGEYGFAISFEDLDAITDGDDNEFLSNLTSFSLEQLGLDHEELFQRLGIDIE